MYNILFFQQPEYSDDEEDSLFVHFSDDNSDILKDVNFAEIIDYDTSLSEKVGVQNIL